MVLPVTPLSFTPDKPSSSTICISLGLLAKGSEKTQLWMNKEGVMVEVYKRNEIMSCG